LQAAADYVSSRPGWYATPPGLGSNVTLAPNVHVGSAAEKEQRTAQEIGSIYGVHSTQVTTLEKLLLGISTDTSAAYWRVGSKRPKKTATG
jgi:hypothetical protein